MSSTKSKIKGMKALAVQFAAVTGASEETGRKLLDVCNGNLEMAIGMQLEGGIDTEALQKTAGPSGNGSVAVDGGASAAGPSSFAAAMENDDNVRAPIPQKQEVLVPDLPTFGPRPKRKGGNASVFDKFRDFQAETKQQEEMIRKGGTNSALAAKKKTLEDLFRPPLDIMHKGTLNTAREYGQSRCKWVIVNVQNVQEFSCQQLNRDVWSDQTVKSIIKESFVFWQVYHDSDEGKRFMQFYKVLDYPYVAVIDPRTGEQMASWSRLDNMSFCDLAIQFLNDHPMFDKDGISPPAKRIKTQKSIIDASEDSQLEAAIAASLAESSSTANSNQDQEPAIPSSASVSAYSTTTVRRKIISSVPAPDDDDSNLSFQSVNDSDSDVEEDQGDACQDSVDVCSREKASSREKAARCKDKSQEAAEGTSTTNPSVLQRTGKQRRDVASSQNGEKDIEGKKQQTLPAKKDQRVKAHERQRSKDCEAGKAGPSREGQSSKDKDEIGEPEAATSCQQNGGIKPVEESAVPDRADEESVPDGPDGNDEDVDEEDRVACDADDIDPSNACNLMLRLPDGRRKQVTLQATDTLLTLVKLVGKEGFPNERYELVTTFPRRRLSYLDINTNLKAAGLFPQETIFIQER